MDALERHPPTSPDGPVRDRGPGDLTPAEAAGHEDDLETWVRPETTEWLVGDALDGAPAQHSEVAQLDPPPSPWITADPPAPVIASPAPLVPPPAAPVPRVMAPDDSRTRLAVADLEARLVVAERELEAMETARDRERARAEELEREVVHLRARAEVLESQAAQADRRVAAIRGGLRDAAGRLELNSATVEALHGVGLSMTQACRIVVARDARGGFQHPGEIADVPGIPAPLRDAVMARVYVERGPR